MLVPPSLDELVGTGLAAAQVARDELLLDEGDIAEQDIVSAAAMGTAVAHYGTQLNRQTYLEGCEDEAVLDARIQDRYEDLTRLEAAAAEVTLSFTRASAAAGAGTIAAGTVVATVIDSEGNRQEFTTNSPVTWGGAETGTKTVSATASVEGVDGNVAAGTLTTIVSSLFDATFTVTNVGRAAGGADRETNAQYIARARQYPSTLAKGTAAAVELGALSVPGVRIATASEDEDSGVSTLFVADASGGSNAELVLRVITELEDWRAMGAVFAVTGGELLSTDVTVTLELRFGTAADLSTLVQEAITDEMALLGGGETFYRSRIVAAVINAAPDRIKNAVVTVPAADVVPLSHQIIRAGTLGVA